MNLFFPNYPAYRVTSPFGIRTLRGVTKMHNGIDLVATRDGKTGHTDHITAHTGGTVSAVGFGTSQGNYIKIQTAPRVEMVYYHLREKPAFQKGDTVETGQPIGHMGATGNVTGAHLHFGIRADGQWIDPAPYLEGFRADVELPVLCRGDKTAYVRTMQALLLAKGHGVGKCGMDGSFGPATAAALKALQKQKGLPLRSLCGTPEWKALLEV